MLVMMLMLMLVMMLMMMLMMLMLMMVVMLMLKAWEVMIGLEMLTVMKLLMKEKEWGRRLFAQCLKSAARELGSNPQLSWEATPDRGHGFDIGRRCCLESEHLLLPQPWIYTLLRRRRRRKVCDP